jgi:hypothetical protein
MRKLTVTIPDTLYRDLEEIAQSQGRSLSNLVSFLLEFGLQNWRDVNIQLGAEDSHDLQTLANAYGLSPITLAESIILNYIQNARDRGEISEMVLKIPSSGSDSESSHESHEE